MTISTIARTVSPVVFLALAACGGSNGGATNPTVSPGGNKALLEALQAENESLFATRVSTLPGSGGGNYSGFAQVASDGSVVPAGEAVGRADLNITFNGAAAAGVVDGRFYDFDDPTGTYTGELDVQSTALVQEDGRTVIDHGVSGTLTRNTGEVIDIEGSLRGRFFGADRQYLVGAGKATVESGTQSGTAEIFMNVVAD